MDIFDNEDIKMQFFEEFKKIDALYDTFKKEFDAEITAIIRQHHPDFKPSERFNELLSQFSVAALSIAHSVLDRDTTYPNFRKTEDLKALQAYYVNTIQAFKNKELAEQIHKKTKELVVMHLPKIVDLSADGFRLLELNLKLFNLEFIGTFNNLEA